MDLKVFLDFGNLWGVDFDSSIDDSNEIRSSAGISANWKSPIGPINFTLAQNLLKADTDKTESFSFNLGTTFNMKYFFQSPFLFFYYLLKE